MKRLINNPTPKLMIVEKINSLEILYSKKE